MDTRIGEGFAGSGDWMTTSAANQDILAGKGKNYYKFSIHVNKACHVLINNQFRLYIDDTVGLGFESEYIDPLITNFVIEESGVSYNWIGAY